MLEALNELRIQDAKMIAEAEEARRQKLLAKQASAMSKSNVEDSSMIKGPDQTEPAPGFDNGDEIMEEINNLDGQVPEVLTLSENSIQDGNNSDDDIEMIDNDIGVTKRENNKAVYIPSSDEEDDEDEDAAKARRFKHLEKEANLRIGFGVPVESEEDEEEMEIDDRKPHNKYNSHKKKSKQKKSSQGNHGLRGSDGKLKQTKLIFTPKDNQINLTGRKRQPESSIDQFDDDPDD